MKYQHHQTCLLALSALEVALAFQSLNGLGRASPKQPLLSPAFVSIGLGPEEPKTEEEKRLEAGIDYEIPNHEEFRTSRRSKLDEKCDAWFGALLEGEGGCLGDISEQAKATLTTPVPLVNEEEKPIDDPDYTPFISTRLPWTPLVPAYGLEEFGLPVPRRNAETWRHFDVAGMIEQSYSFDSKEGSIDLSEEQTEAYRAGLEASGTWLDDEACEARLVYVDGKFASQLSKTTEFVYNMDGPMDDTDSELNLLLSRLTDGFTDELATPVPCNDDESTSYSKLSKPNHNIGSPTSQFAVNTQQGSACFAALNTYKTKAVAYVNAPPNHNEELDEFTVPKPVLILNAMTSLGGVEKSLEDDKGVACHPRTIVVAEDGARMSVVQSCVDLDTRDDAIANPKLYNGYTQVFVKGTANVTHSYLEESGGFVTAGVEKTDDEFEDDEELARGVEAKRPALKDTHLEAIDVHVMGEEGAYQGTVMSLGGSGRIRINLSVSLLRSKSHASVNGFSLSGGAQRSDMKTNIHHIAQGTSSAQIQKNMIGGRATGAFRGRIRVEQSAQQTDSQQLSRTILLSDKCRAWAIPSLEIIADDVQCAHGATISDLSEEELFYLRSRGLDRTTARNMLMYAFADDIAACVDPAILGTLDGSVGLQKRIIQRLENVVPRGDRAVKAEFHSI
mmetsp:Transcript_15583/g.34019  ORF Transcript_15583/g.34019 Transcript_15583/m.34019 type:complete len:674 (-) Transcript_15583:96-2117(-)|eukprot:CAMPEP_0168755514 /NCGR_PEP_ID=MMETSP0724-20121128/20111_1 /TAXON_ID=265536 /ORGANISM="Amphiprora sp., Strain CCMP467" /LENGTH=673 /DNA_ID=CAMNT_0008804137 /DNA_START=2000 /DNA_END=4021 /DNA_ORIENTATION=+